MASRVDWYFDVISPFAHLQMQVLPSLRELDIQYRPILFAGLLNHWGQLGPAEIPSKRVHTYSYVRWLAGKHGLQLNIPAAHPFNPLPLLRLAVLVGNDHGAVKRIFEPVWRDGSLPQDEHALAALVGELGVEPDEISAPETKNKLKANTDEAISRGVFGVPSFVVGDQIFWGFDATDMLIDFLEDPERFADDTRRIRALPEAARRK